jgi:hypothetical protein
MHHTLLVHFHVSRHDLQERDEYQKNPMVVWTNTSSVPSHSFSRIMIESIADEKTFRPTVLIFIVLESFVKGILIDP